MKTQNPTLLSEKLLWLKSSLIAMGYEYKDVENSSDIDDSDYMDCKLVKDTSTICIRDFKINDMEAVDISTDVEIKNDNNSYHTIGQTMIYINEDLNVKEVMHEILKPLRYQRQNESNL